MKLRPGTPYPLGATPDGAGTNFSLFSRVAERVELCLFDAAGGETRVDLPEVTGFCWHGSLPGVGPGQLYGYRVHGPWEPRAGHRCNPAKLLVCPYARAVEGSLVWEDALFPYQAGDPDGPPSRLDSAPFVPKSMVVDPAFDWDDDRPPRTPLEETVIYEVHVKGFTARHPGVPEELRGTYAGLAHPAAIDHLTRLGVTAVELLPVHQFIDDAYVWRLGRTNYWGYNTLSFFAPHAGYASRRGHPGRQVREFRRMVQELHRAGIEVLLDVVYNHTCEGDHLGPLLSLKGIDNAEYYRLRPDDPRRYLDTTGTGNSLNVESPYALQLVLDSLRYWVEEMHVDGFRFDLAASLGRGPHGFDPGASFFDAIQQDPVIRRVKLIAEPWDLGVGGDQAGRFPYPWSEWNGRYRDAVRDFWRGAGGVLDDLGWRLTGSADLFEAGGRRPQAGINFVTAHDGFTLTDLVSYDRKHNEANAEDGRDGESHNRSWNHGVEGPTDDPGIERLRLRQKRNLLATLLLSQGVPMLLGGDEIGRTQGGNNNAYNQDNEVSWLDWERADRELLEFTRRLIRLRREHPTFRRRSWFKGCSAAGLCDVAWLRPDGEEMVGGDWGNGSRSLGVLLDGEAIPDRDRRGEPQVDDSFYLILNAHAEPVAFALPARGAAWWREVVSTAGERPAAYAPGEEVLVEGRSLVLLVRMPTLV